jgi:hypothetical protein
MWQLGSGNLFLIMGALTLLASVAARKAGDDIASNVLARILQGTMVLLTLWYIGSLLGG